MRTPKTTTHELGGQPDPVSCDAPFSQELEPDWLEAWPAQQLWQGQSWSRCASQQPTLNNPCN